MPWRKLLFPFSIVYGAISLLRNKCYDLGLLHSWKIPVKSICVGNLSTGGTGKTPHVIHLASHFSDIRKVAILSRGYGRSTKGFRLVTSESCSSDVGDEPLSYALRFGSKVIVAVCESRKDGILQLLDIEPSIDLILLDDAFQHRAVKAGFNVLLTQANKPYSSDLLLPAGDLRESRIGRNRAQMVIVTKCKDVGRENYQKWSDTLDIRKEKLNFSEIVYGEPVAFGKKISYFREVLLVTGIADPTPLKNHLSRGADVTCVSFNDHYEFSWADIQKIHQKFDTFATEKSVIITTEKDFARLRNHVTDWKLNEYPWYYIPITVRLENETEFFNVIQTYVDSI
jgi:tetraacyldisaccharide 4'-kinase